MTPASPKSATSSEARGQQIMKDLSAEARSVLRAVLELENEHLSHQNPNATALAREIADIVRREVKR